MGYLDVTRTGIAASDLYAHKRLKDGSGIDLERVLFEAPNKDLQIQLIRKFGSEVNLGNISSSDIVALETLRLGLRGDTLLDWDEADA